MRRLWLLAVGAGLLAATAVHSQPAPLASSALRDYRRAILGQQDGGWDEILARLAGARGEADAHWSLRAALAEIDCLGRSGRGAQAAAQVRALVAAHRHLPDWAMWAMARGCQAHDPATARTLYRRLVALRPASVLRPDAVFALGALAAEPAQAASYWRMVVDEYPGDALAERAMARLATNGSPESRRSWARRYHHRYPDGPNHLDVVRGWVALGGLNATERLAVAQDLLEVSDYRAALKLLTGLNSPLAQFRRGRALWRLGDVEAGMRAIRSAGERDAGLWRRSRIVLGQIAEAQKRRDAAASYYRAAADGRHDDACEALTRLGALYRRIDDEANAAALDRELVERFPEASEAIEARFRLMWRAYAAGARGEAARWAGLMGDSSPVKVEGPGGLYWLGRLREDDGNLAGATEAYQAAVSRSPRSYYGWRSRHRLEAIRSSQADPGFGVRPVEARLPSEELAGLVDPDAKPTSEYVQAARILPAALRELTYLGQVEAALRWAKAHEAAPNLKAWLALNGGRYREAIAFSDGSDPRLSYPLGYYPMMREAAAMQGLDPLLLTSLVKQESLFDPHSRSWVGAMGLTQVMPQTASWVGRKVPGPVRPLTDPFWNLKLGAYYLAWVQHRLADQPLYAVAAYNAGPGAVEKWNAAFGQGSADAWVERIPYPETRHYVKKVFANYWTYRMLYGQP